MLASNLETPYLRLNIAEKLEKCPCNCPRTQLAALHAHFDICALNETLQIIYGSLPLTDRIALFQPIITALCKIYNI
jgi:hypothetical protein